MIVYVAKTSGIDGVQVTYSWRPAAACLTSAAAGSPKKPHFARLPAPGSTKRDFDSSGDPLSRGVGAQFVVVQLASLHAQRKKSFFWARPTSQQPRACSKPVSVLHLGFAQLDIRVDASFNWSLQLLRHPQRRMSEEQTKGI